MMKYHEKGEYDPDKFAEYATRVKLISCFHKIKKEKEEAKQNGTTLTYVPPPRLATTPRRRFLFGEKKRTRKEIWRDQIDNIQEQYPGEDPLRIHEWIVRRKRPSWVLATLRSECQERERRSGGNESRGGETTALADDVSSSATGTTAGSVRRGRGEACRESHLSENATLALRRLMDAHPHADPERVAEALSKYSVETVRVMLRARTRSLTVHNRVEV